MGIASAEEVEGVGLVEGVNAAHDQSRHVEETDEKEEAKGEGPGDEKEMTDEAKRM